MARTQQRDIGGTGHRWRYRWPPVSERASAILAEPGLHRLQSPLCGIRGKASRLGRSVAVAAGVFTLAGCGSSGSAAVAGRCGSARTDRTVRLVLGLSGPYPTLTAAEGVAVEVVRSNRGFAMTFPSPYPAGAVCEVSQHRGAGGAAAVLFKAVRATTVTFVSTYLHPPTVEVGNGNIAIPDLEGIFLVVRAAQGAGR